MTQCTISKRYIESTRLKGEYWVIVRDCDYLRFVTVFDTKREARRVADDLAAGKYFSIMVEEEWV